MKLNKLILLLSVIIVSSCKKEKTTTAPAASLTIINTVVGTSGLVTNFGNSYNLPDGYANALQIGYGSWSTYYQFGAYSGNQQLKLYQYPDTTVHKGPLFDLTLNLLPQSIHTLFLAGTVSSPDTLFTTDTLPYHPNSDSSIGIRFINLSPGSNAVNVILSTSSMTNEFAGLVYKAVTKFKNYPVIASVNSYTFQIRNAATNAIIATQTLSGINNGTGTNTSTNQYRYRNITIALIGQPGGTGAATQKALLIKNY